MGGKRLFALVAGSALLSTLLASVACVTPLAWTLGKLAFDVTRPELNRLLTAVVGKQTVSIPFQGTEVTCGLGSCQFPVKAFLVSKLGKEAGLVNGVSDTFALTHGDLGALARIMDRSQIAGKPIASQQGGGVLDCSSNACHLGYQLASLSDLQGGLSLSSLIAKAAEQRPGRLAE